MPSHGSNHCSNTGNPSTYTAYEYDYIFWGNSSTSSNKNTKQYDQEANEVNQSDSSCLSGCIIMFILIFIISVFILWAVLINNDII